MDNFGYWDLSGFFSYFLIQNTEKNSEILHKLQATRTASSRSKYSAPCNCSNRSGMAATVSETIAAMACAFRFVFFANQRYK